MNFFLLSAIKAVVVAAVLLTTLAYLQWIERKVLASHCNRIRAAIPYTILAIALPASYVP